VRINIPEGIRPVRVLGNAADINGQSVITRLAQVYSQQQKHVVIEVEVPESVAVAPSDGDGAMQALATVAVTYTNMLNHQQETLDGAVSVSFSSSDEKVKASRDNEVMADVVALIASEQNKIATEMLDQGNLAECRKVLKDNAAFLSTNSVLLQCPSLESYAESNRIQLKRLEGVESKFAPGAVSSRKIQRDYQLKIDQQAPSGVNP
jgi:Ca-activated chloride channel family protein